MSGIFLVSLRAEIWPLSQWDLGDFFPNEFEKKYLFFLEFLFSHPSHNTHKLHGDTSFFPFNLMAIVCVIADLF